MKVVATILFVLLASLLFGLLLSFPMMLLWNACLVPAVSGVAEITWLQAWGLMFLARLILDSKVEGKVN